AHRITVGPPARTARAAVDPGRLHCVHELSVAALVARGNGFPLCVARIRRLHRLSHTTTIAGRHPPLYPALALVITWPKGHLSRALPAQNTVGDPCGRGGGRVGRSRLDSRRTAREPAAARRQSPAPRPVRAR